MAKKEPDITATAKITPAQKSAIQDHLSDMTESEFVREAIKEKILREGGEWPEHEFMTHGGRRVGAGRKRKAREPRENGG